MFRFLSSLILHWRAAAQRRRARNAFDQLDDATLRDLAITRSEAASCALEAAGQLPRTRRRVSPALPTAAGL